MASSTVPNPMPTENPLISVVMPCYNCAPYLAEAVGSALRQSYRNVELILVDDGSIDESPNIEGALVQQHGARLCLLHSVFEISVVESDQHLTASHRTTDVHPDRGNFA